MSLMHIRGVQPSKAIKTKRQRISTIPSEIANLHKNIQKIVTSKKQKDHLPVQSSSSSVTNFMDGKCFRFLSDYCLSNNQIRQRLQINTQECNNFLSKHNIEFINERTQEISHATVYIKTKSKQKKKNSATFVLQLPDDYNNMLLLLLLLKVDFNNMRIDFSPGVGNNFQRFLSKAHKSGFKLYYDFIRLNMSNKRFLTTRG